MVQQDDYVPFSKLFGDYAKSTLVGERPKKAAAREQQRCTLSIACDSYAKNIAVRLYGAATLVAECDEPLDRNIRTFAMRGREDARSEPLAGADQDHRARALPEALRQPPGDGPRLPERPQHGRRCPAEAALYGAARLYRPAVRAAARRRRPADRARPPDQPHGHQGRSARRRPIDEHFLDQQPTADSPRSALILSANVSGELILKGQSLWAAADPRGRGRGAEDQGAARKVWLAGHAAGRRVADDRERDRRA